MDAPRSTALSPGFTARSDKSWPAQKPRPAPVNSSTRTLASALILSSASRTSRCMATVKLLSLSGRFSVMTAMPLLFSNRMDSYCMAASSDFLNWFAGLHHAKTAGDEGRIGQRCIGSRIGAGAVVIAESRRLIDEDAASQVQRQRHTSIGGSLAQGFLDGGIGGVGRQ